MCGEQLGHSDFRQVGTGSSPHARGNAIRCWWGEPGQSIRDESLAVADTLPLDADDPRLLAGWAVAGPDDEPVAGLGAGEGGQIPRLGLGVVGEHGARIGQVGVKDLRG